MLNITQDKHDVTQVDPDKPVLVAGDPELKHMAYCAHLGGIPYHPNVASLMVCILSYKNKMSVYVIMVEAYIIYFYEWDGPSLFPSVVVDLVVVSHLSKSFL